MPPPAPSSTVRSPATVSVLSAFTSSVKVLPVGALNDRFAVSPATFINPTTASPSPSISNPAPADPAVEPPSLISIFASFTCKFWVSTVVVVPLTVKFPPTTRFPETSAAPLISMLAAVRSISAPASKAESSILPLLETVKLVPSPEINSALSPNANLSPDDTRAVPLELLCVITKVSSEPIVRTAPLFDKLRSSPT